MTNQSNVPELMTDLVKILEELGAQAVELHQSQAKESRAERQRKWKLPNPILNEQEVVNLKTLPDVLGQAPTPQEFRELSQMEVDDIAYELLQIRPSQDLLKGRHEALRDAVFNGITSKYLTDEKCAEPEFMPDSLISHKHGVELTKQIRGGHPYTSWEELESVLTEDVWLSITDEVITMKIINHPDGTYSEEETRQRIINELALMRAFQEDRVTLEHLKAIQKVSPKVPAFIVKNIS